MSADCGLPSPLWTVAYARLANYTRSQFFDSCNATPTAGPRHPVYTLTDGQLPVSGCVRALLAGEESA